MFIPNRNFRKVNFNILSLHESQFDFEKFNTIIYGLFEHYAFYTFEFHETFYIHLLKKDGYVAYSIPLKLNNYNPGSLIINNLKSFFKPDINFFLNMIL
jgi:hypothetical protein